ncbi:MAG TPA: hypothetical protein VJU59_09175 [Paraburkholderia sp.]|uniref:hypothetical protein n=1 Tax=Paraburkholderia sp. TaxID=1926495 RepID=UPI002B47CF1C|nr:hypothetical protein [Paraburkholderia sp.]HKR39836.1 hypothetical protein [Paraburkholderia sp.]
MVIAIVLFLLFVFLFAGIPASIARDKGRNFWPWFWFAVFFAWVPVMFAAMVIAPDYRIIAARQKAKEEAEERFQSADAPPAAKVGADMSTKNILIAIVLFVAVVALSAFVLRTGGV